MLAAYPTFFGRMRAMRDHGQTSTGLIEDSLVIGTTIGIVAAAS